MIPSAVWLDVGIILVIVWVIIYFAVRERYKYFKKRNIAYSEPYFLIGNTLDILLFRENFINLITNLYKKFPNERIIGFFQGLQPCLIVRDPDLVTKVLAKDFSNFHDRGFFVDEVTNPLEGNLFNLSGSKWKTLRSKLTPIFTSGKLKGMFGLMEQCVDKLVRKVEMLDGEDVDLKDLLSCLTSDIIGSCGFGIDFKSLDNCDSQFKKMAKKVFEPDIYFMIVHISRVFFPSLFTKIKIKSVPSDVNEFFFTIVKEMFDNRLKTNIKRNDCIQLLLELREKGEVHKDLEEIKEDEMFKKELEDYQVEDTENLVITDELLTAQCFIFFVAGYETAATGLSFVCYFLCKHPEIQEKLRQHVQEIKKKHGGITYSAVKEMNYLEACINESLRLYSPVGMFMRKCNTSIYLGDHYVEAGTPILIPVDGLHNDEVLFPDSQTFRPERFMNDEIISGSFLPFGAGPRQCIAQRFGRIEMKLTVARLIDNFKIKSSPKMNLKEPLKLKVSNFFPTPVNGIQCRFVKINS